jgi:thiol:disulfide interchange protein
MCTKILFTFSCLLQVALSLKQGGGWWEQTKGTTIHTAEELDTLIDENPGKFIMLDFYMQNCHWCQVFQPEWNKLVDDFADWFGPSVIFAKVDGP